MMIKATFRQVLCGCRPGRMQTVAHMQMIPLLAEPELDDDRFASPAQARAVVSTTNYGSLKIQNPSPSVLLVPPHAAYMTKKAAQDHALPAGGMLKAGDSRVFGTAICIEETQGGTMPDGEHEMHLLPLGLRERAWDCRYQQGYGRLWDDIRTFNRGFGIPGNAHMCYFFDRFEDELDVFVAEFEPVRRQVGAIFLIDGQLAGLERSPSAAFFRSIWRPLVRDCYGSRAMVAARESEGRPPATIVPLRSGATTLDELADHLAEAAEEEERLVRRVVDPILSEEVDMSLDHALELQGEDTQLLSLETSRFSGQVIRTEAGRVIFASLVTSEARRAAVADQAARTAEPFTF
jgi:hypothetical protein